MFTFLVFSVSILNIYLQFFISCASVTKSERDFNILTKIFQGQSTIACLPMDCRGGTVVLTILQYYPKQDLPEYSTPQWVDAPDLL